METRHVGPEIRRLNNQIKRALERNCSRPDGFTGLHGWIIHYISEQESPVFQCDLERRFSVRGSTMSNLLSLMEKNGLLRREPYSKDGRRKRLLLTDAARALERTAKSDAERLESLLTRGIDENELSSFFATVDKIKANLAGEENQNPSGGRK